MSLKTSPIMKMPDIGKIADTTTRLALEQIIRFMYENQLRIYDDLARLESLPVYASNAAAIAGGLSTGSFYRNGDNVCVVH